MVFFAGDGTTGKVLTAVSPYVQTAVKAKYGGKSEKPNICPGEADCDRFQSAKGKTQATKERNACFPCKLFDTKRERFRRSQKGLDDLVSASEYVQRRRDSGYPVQEYQVSNLMLETLLMLDECRDREERHLKVEMRAALIAGFGLKVQ